MVMQEFFKSYELLLSIFLASLALLCCKSNCWNILILPLGYQFYLHQIVI